MLGYKIATHVTQYGNDIDYSYSYYVRKVLVVLDVPDDVKRTTPEMRYSKVPPSGLTATELNEWGDEAQTYKAYPDVYMLFHDVKDSVNKLKIRPSHFDSRCKISACKHYIHVKKCRAAKAKVVKIIDLTDGTCYDRAVSDYDAHTIYQTGETVVPDAYTDDYLNICGHGIHYFESPEVALLYYAVRLSLSDAKVFLDYAEELIGKLRKGGDI